MNTCILMDCLDFELHLNKFQLYHIPKIRNMSWDDIFVISYVCQFVCPSVRLSVCELYVKVLL